MPKGDKFGLKLYGALPRSHQISLHATKVYLNSQRVQRFEFQGDLKKKGSLKGDFKVNTFNFSSIRAFIA